ncbi:hypothetical protein SAMN05660236_0845 [Ohtaekwangia koreensis]|uniref:Ferric uptake regulator family protein n=1 Tax=Ohtaekwangia koreensis TaxID=688867 RepID=A0A1T5J7L3_9BACT|nr:hypothetical protein SAMN05660236_0845 [Ohtaekwangia koreensis]
MNRTYISICDYKNDQHLINVLELYSIQPTIIRLQVLKTILVFSDDEFTGNDILTELQKVYPEFQNHTLFSALIAFSRKGLIAKRPERKNKPGRPSLVFSVPLLVLSLFGK